MLDVTMPWQQRMEEANERKKAKFTDLVEEQVSTDQAPEVGCKCFAA